MRITRFKGTGYAARRLLRNGEFKDPFTPDSYDTPYQFIQDGLFVTLRSSYGFDATASPSGLVATPTKAGERSDGWVLVNGYQMHPLPGAANIATPLTATLTATDSESIPYAPSASNWAGITVSANWPGALVQVPMAAATKLYAGQKVASANGGYAKLATTGDYIQGIVEIDADNSTGVAGAVMVMVRLSGDQPTA